MTTDQRLASALRDHYAEEPVERADRERVTGAALDQISSTPQGRHRLWPFSVDSVVTRGSWFPRHESSPASKGHAPARGFTVFSALKLVAAGVIVALFGGFLLTGILTTQQGDEHIPAAMPTSAAGTVATCPPGSTPDQPGPAGQPRPPGGQLVAAAFDRAAGKVVYLTDPEGIRETWLFDVCTNTWSLAQQGSEPDTLFGSAVYDPVAGLTMLVSNDAVWAYDLPSNTWMQREAPPFVGMGPVRLAVDSGIGRMVALSLGPPYPMWSYDAAVDRWHPIEQEGVSAAVRTHTLFSYDGSVDRHFAYGLGADGLGNGGELLDEEMGTWEPVGAESPPFRYGGYISWGGEIVYDEAAGRTVLSSDGAVIAYDAVADRWDDLFRPVADDMTVDPTRYPQGMHGRLLYDPVNERIVLVGGDTRVPDPTIWAPRDDVWAFDARTREWIELVPSLPEEPPSEKLPRAVMISSDVAFAASAPDLTMWSPPLLDVHAPEDAQGLPLVVILPPHSLTKTGSAEVTQLANAVAAQGAVVVVTNWSQLADPPNTFEDPAALEEIARLGQSYAGCAVSFAVSHAGDYGADPSRLVIVGQLFGGNTASMIALGSPDPFPGCEATADWEATGLVAWDADWLVGMPAWDALGPDAVRAVDALSPWSMLGEAPRIPVALVVSDTWVAATQRCGDRDADWMAWRDPSGSMRERLDEVGAYDDGCQDLGDGAAAMAKQLTAAGFPAETVRLTGSDLAPLTEAIVKVTQTPIG